MFIGRSSELAFLEERYRATGGQLVVLYGRRRIGKTETLRKFCEDKPHVFHSCVECTGSLQLQSFSARLLMGGHPASRYLSVFQSWEQAFSSLPELPSTGKKLLVIDEFPYMVKGDPSIPSILQMLWDTLLKSADIMIVLCGSSMSFMEKEILSEKNPLYGRATGILRMTSLSFLEASRFFPSYSMTDRVTAYAVLGGVPHYLRQFDPERPVEENLRLGILQKGSILYSEVEFLMRQELRETAVYNTIIEAIALGSTKLNEIHQKTGIDKTKLSAYLKNLGDLGIIQREFSISDGVKEHANIQRGLYQVSDPFFRFWYAFVFPYMSELESGDEAGICKHVVMPALDRFTSRAFEEICRDHLRRLNRENALPFRFTAIGRWWDKDNELDIMATDPEHRQFLLGECKYRNRAMNLSDLTATQGKFKPRKPDAKMHYWLFSKSGFTDDLKREAQVRRVELVDMEDLAGC